MKRNPMRPWNYDGEKISNWSGGDAAFNQISSMSSWPTLREVFRATLGQWKSQVWNENAWKLPVIIIPWLTFGSFIADEEAHLSRVCKLEYARKEKAEQFAFLKNKMKQEFEEEMLAAQMF